MEKPNDEIYKEHILGAISLIEQFIHKKSFEEFEKDALLFSAVVRQMEIIGEASKNLSQNYKEMLYYIPWKKITGTRDILIHGYFDVDLQTVWKTATEDIKVLKDALITGKKDSV